MIMTQEDKELLLKDLCARLPYGVILNVTLKDKYDEIVNRDIEMFDNNLTYMISDSHWKTYKPYLRPMSSMTKEEKEEYQYITERWMYNADYSIADSIDWLNAHHFDYRGLIEKGLAIAITENNNPYKK